MKSYLLVNKNLFLSQLLKTDLFDNFLLSEAVIKTGVNLEISGKINKDFYENEDELEQLGIASMEYMPFASVKNLIFEAVKGRHNPLGFKLVLMLSPENLRKTLNATETIFTENDIGGLFFNISYAGEKLTITSGVSYKTFSMDKTLDEAWDLMTKKWLNNNKIEFEEL